MKLDYINFPQRADRSHYIARRFAAYLRDSVLDVGCDKAVLRGLLAKDVAYTGIDIGGTPDITVNLEQTERLPFGDGAFSSASARTCSSTSTISMLFSPSWSG